MIPPSMTRPYTRLSGNPIENCPFQASFKEVRRTGRIETQLAEGALFRDARGRLRTDFRSVGRQVSINLTRVLDPIARTVVLLNHDDQSIVTMDADFDSSGTIYWTSSMTPRRIPAESLGADSCRKTIEGLDCYLLVMDSQLEYEVWVSHRLGYAVREQVRDQDGLRIWTLAEVKLGEIDPGVFSLYPGNLRATA